MKRFEVTLKEGKGEVFKLSGDSCQIHRNKVILIYQVVDYRKEKFIIPMSNVAYIKEYVEVPK